MFYSDVAGLKLHVVANNPQAPVSGLPRRVILTVNHVSTWAEYADEGTIGRAFQSYKDWKIAGDNRSWKVVFTQHILKPVRGGNDAHSRVLSFLVILEQDIKDPEKEIDAPPPTDERQHLRKFNNLILEDQI